MEPKRPSNLEECTFSMSNFDHSIDGELEGALRTSRVYAQHAAWDFCGYVWFADGQFHEDVWQYNAYTETFTADSLPELMQAVNAEWGDD